MTLVVGEQVECSGEYSVQLLGWRSVFNIVHAKEKGGNELKLHINRLCRNQIGPNLKGNVQRECV